MQPATLAPCWTRDANAVKNRNSTLHAGINIEHPLFSSLNAEMRTEFVSRLSIRDYSCGETVFSSQDTAVGLLYIIRGQVAFGLQNESGNHLTLHRMTAKESCMLSFSNTSYYIEASAEEDSTICLLPEGYLSFLRKENHLINEFCIQKEQKFYDLMFCMIERLAFSNLKKRLYQLLEDYMRIKCKNDIIITHELLANDLGTSREVVTRILRQFESEGVIRQERKKIVLL